jgi:hypothetical protein
MEKPPPKDAAQPKDELVSEEAAQEEKSPRKPRRIPTALLVTIVLAVVSVWVAPALTRQWEDRKSARDLQAELTETISAASARALAQLASAAENPGGDTDIERAKQEWLIAQYRVQARIAAYFSNRAWNTWLNHADLVESMFVLLQVAEHPRRPVQSQHVVCSAPVETRRCWKDAVEYMAIAEQEVDNDQFGTRDEPDQYAVEYSPAGLRDLLLRFAQPDITLSVDWVNETILKEHPRGYSMNRQDFFNDLLP